MKILVVTTVSSTLNFFEHQIGNLINEGHEVEIASNFNVGTIHYNVDRLKKHQIDFSRSIRSKSNVKAYKQIKKVCSDNEFDIIHTHTPIASAIVRLQKINPSTKLIYTAHGFHFFRGAPLKNWLLFYPIEKYLSRYTDVLITMNDEDYDVSINKFNARRSMRVPGVGIDLERFDKCTNEEKNQLRDVSGYNKDQFILIYVAELSNRKNQIQLLRVANLLKDRIKNLKILIVGTGEKESDLKKFVSFENLEGIVEFLGYRNDISNLMSLSDIVVSTSKQEGLPVNLLEALGVGKPIIATDVRGNRDLVINNFNGFVSEVNNDKAMLENIMRIYNDKQLQLTFSENSNEMSKKYDINNTLKIISQIYFN